MLQWTTYVLLCNRVLPLLLSSAWLSLTTWKWWKLDENVFYGIADFICTFWATKKALRFRDICRRLRELATPTTEQSLTSLSYLPFIQMPSFRLLHWFSYPNIFLSDSRISHKPTLLRGRSIFHPSRCQGFDWNTNLICVKRQVAFLLLCQNKGEQMIMSIDIKNIKMII